MRMAISKALFSNTSDEYETPKSLYDLLNDVFHFQLDPCAKPNIESQKRILTINKYTKDDDGLTQDWPDCPTFINPPYSQIKKWINKAIKEYEKRTHNFSKHPEPIVLLVPARIDTMWFHEIANRPYTKIVFIKGRLKFNNTKTNAPFPSAIIILSPSSYIDFLYTFGTLIPSWTIDLKGLKKEEEDG